jgi:hypothetical protein
MANGNNNGWILQADGLYWATDGWCTVPSLARVWKTRRGADRAAWRVQKRTVHTVWVLPV